MPNQPTLLAMDFEGVFVPEIWIAVSERTGLAELRFTTRDIPDYDQLMQNRLRILREHKLTLKDIQTVIGTLEPLPGAAEFTQWAKARVPLIILTDSYYEFVAPLLAKLDYPAAFCNSLEVDAQHTIVNYHLRQRDGKRKAVAGFKSLGFRVIACGDSYNDTTMLGEAEAGILFRPPANVIADFPQYPVCHTYADLQAQITERLPA